MAYPAPLTIPCPSDQPTQPATIIFLHGLGDDANRWTDLVSQIHSARKLPYVNWILPNAPQNHDALTTAWYRPKPFSPIPMPRRSGEPEMEENEEEDDEERLKQSVEYICTLIDKEVKAGKVPLERIVVGGFSQGCAIALLAGLMSRYAGRLGGVIGLSGYLPLAGKVRKIVEERREKGGKTKYFLAHGSKDQLVPRREFLSYKYIIENSENGSVTATLYEGMGHSTSGDEIRDLVDWLEAFL